VIADGEAKDNGGGDEVSVAGPVGCPVLPGDE
jgi:hypothetical protein